MAIRRWKVFEDIFIHFDRIHKRDRQTDNARQQRPRLCIASRGSNIYDKRICCSASYGEDNQVVPASRGLSTVQQDRNTTTLRSPKQQIWHRTAFCGGRCRRMALYSNLRVACQKRRRRRVFLMAGHIKINETAQESWSHYHYQETVYTGYGLKCPAPMTYNNHHLDITQVNRAQHHRRAECSCCLIQRHRSDWSTPYELPSETSEVQLIQWRPAQACAWMLSIVQCSITVLFPHSLIVNGKQEVKVIWQKAPHGGGHSPVRGHPKGSKVVPLNSSGMVSY